MANGFDLHDRIDDQYGEDSYINQTFDDSPTYGADFMPDDADSAEYADDCDAYESDASDDFPDEVADGFGNRYGYSDEILQY